jgi:hypothetical protein
MNFKDVDRAVDRLLEKDKRAGVNADKELRASITASKQAGGKWQDCQEPPGITYSETEYSPTNQDGSFAKWQWGVHGDCIYCKTSIYKEATGWTSTVGKKPLFFSDALLMAIKPYLQTVKNQTTNERI